jgi:hypothetical protein
MEMSNNKQQTAVEWLFGQIPSACKSSKGAHDALEQAKEMEKEQIKKAVNFGDERGNIVSYSTAEQYYNETYGGGER